MCSSLSSFIAVGAVVAGISPKPTDVVTTSASTAGTTLSTSSMAIADALFNTILAPFEPKGRTDVSRSFAGLLLAVTVLSLVSPLLLLLLAGVDPDGTESSLGFRATSIAFLINPSTLLTDGERDGRTSSSIALTFLTTNDDDCSFEFVGHIFVGTMSLLPLFVSHSLLASFVLSVLLLLLLFFIRSFAVASSWLSVVVELSTCGRDSVSSVAVLTDSFTLDDASVVTGDDDDILASTGVSDRVAVITLLIATSDVGTSHSLLLSTICAGAFVYTF